MSDNNLSMNYEAVLEDLRVKREALDQAISAIEKIVGITPSAASGSASRSNEAEIRSDTFFGLSIPDAMRKYLQMSKTTKSAKDIADALIKGGLKHNSADFGNTVGSVLNRLNNAGNSIVRVKRGEYGLVDWYPSLKRKKSAKNGNEESEGVDDQSENPNDPSEIFK